jgi:hypothetical protein
MQDKKTLIFDFTYAAVFAAFLWYFPAGPRYYQDASHENRFFLVTEWHLPRSRTPVEFIGSINLGMMLIWLRETSKWHTNPYLAVQVIVCRSNLLFDYERSITSDHPTKLDHG